MWPRRGDCPLGGSQYRCQFSFRSGIIKLTRYPRTHTYNCSRVHTGFCVTSASERRLPEGVYPPGNLMYGYLTGAFIRHPSFYSILSVTMLAFSMQDTLNSLLTKDYSSYYKHSSDGPPLFLVGLVMSLSCLQ